MVCPSAWANFVVNERYNLRFELVSVNEQFISGMEVEGEHRAARCSSQLLKWAVLPCRSSAGCCRQHRAAFCASRQRCGGHEASAEHRKQSVKAIPAGIIKVKTEMAFYSINAASSEKR